MKEGKEAKEEVKEGKEVKEEVKEGKEKKKKKVNVDYSIRSINLKIDPTEEQITLLDDNIQAYTDLHDAGINRYARLPEITKEAMNEESKKMRREFKSEDCDSTFVDLATGSRGAYNYYFTLKKMAEKDILFRDKEIKKIEKDNPNLIKLKSVHFNPAKKFEGICTMCGREGKIPFRSNEKEYGFECICEVCAVDFFKYRAPLKSIKRHIMKNYILCKELAEKKNLSEGLRREINRFGKSVETFKKTVSNKFKIKPGRLKINFDTKTAILRLKDGQKIEAPFSGDHYYKNFPKYGLDSDVLKYKKLVTDFLDGGGYPFLIRKFLSDGKKEYYLSIPTHYPIVKGDNSNIEGCVLVSQRRVLLYINDKAKFIELYNPYLKKRIFGKIQKDVQDKNKELCICDYNRIPKKNHMLLVNLKKKLGFSWIDEYEVTVTKSEDGKKVVVQDDNNLNRRIEIFVVKEIGKDTDTDSNSEGYATLTSIDVNGEVDREEILYIAERKKRFDKKDDGEEKYRRLDLYVSPQITLPKKYSGGNLLKHIRHKNKQTARQIVEEAKKLLNGGVLVMIDYRGMHPEGEGVVPMGALNDQIRNMLRYDSIYRGSIYWKNLKNLICPNCHNTLPDKLEGVNRLIIRDIFLSDTTRWVCEEEICRKKINNPLIAVARHIMNSDIEKLLKPPSKKEVTADEEAVEIERLSQQK